MEKDTLSAIANTILVRECSKADKWFSEEEVALIISTMIKFQDCITSKTTSSILDKIMYRVKQGVEGGANDHYRYHNEMLLELHNKILDEL